MNLEHIQFEPQRPALTVHPEIDDATGEYLGQVAEFSTAKDAYDYNESGLTQEEWEDALSPEQKEEYYAQQQQEVVSEADAEPYSLEEIDQQFETPDEPSQEMAQIAFNMELPDTPAHDVVQVLSTKYYMGEISVDEALDIAFAQGINEDDLRKAWSDVHRKFQQHLNR